MMGIVRSIQVYNGVKRAFEGNFKFAAGLATLELSSDMLSNFSSPSTKIMIFFVMIMLLWISYKKTYPILVWSRYHGIYEKFNNREEGIRIAKSCWTFPS